MALTPIEPEPAVETPPGSEAPVPVEAEAPSEPEPAPPPAELEVTGAAAERRRPRARKKGRKGIKLTCGPRVSAAEKEEGAGLMLGRCWAERPAGLGWLEEKIRVVFRTFALDLAHEQLEGLFN